MSRLPATAALLLAAVAAGCAVRTQTFDPALYAWPFHEPRVRLERIVERQRDAAGGLAGWVRGQKDAPLFARPYGVAWDGDDLVVTDPGASAVLRLGADRKVRRSRAGLFASPIGVAACAEGVVVTDARAGSVALLDEQLHLVRWLARDLERPTGVAVYRDEIYVMETAKHRLLRLDGDVPEVVTGGRGDASGQLNFPVALAADAGGLWLGDTLNFRVQHLVPGAGAEVRVFGELGDASGEMPRIKDVAVDPLGRLWISDAYLNQVALFTAEGAYLMSLGRVGNAPGEFSFPTGIAAHPDGRVAVVDSMNRRLQVFSLVPPDDPKGESP
jgi:sugar lactone lactonase YvrE